MIPSNDGSANAVAGIRPGPPHTGTPPAAGLPVWMLALAALLLVMVGANGYMVWLSSHERHDLVRADYYDAGLQEDKTIALNAASHAAGHVVLRHTREGWEVETSADAIDAATCRAYFYRPDDDRQDHMIELSRANPRGSGGPSTGALWRASGADLRRGKWNVKLVWERSGEPVSETTLGYRAP
jgi:hypothetical protein